MGQRPSTPRAAHVPTLAGALSQNDIHRKSTALRKLEKELQARVLKVNQLEEEVVTQRNTVETLRGHLQQSRQDAAAAIVQNGGSPTALAERRDTVDAATSPMAADESAELTALQDELDFVAGQLGRANRVRM